MKDVVIVSGVRTAQGKFSGALKDFSAPQLGSLAIKGAVEKAGISSKDVDEVIMGCVVPAGLGQNVARQAAIGAGIPYEAGAFHVDKVCGSSLKAVVLAAQAIKCDDAEIIVAGGMESMSNVPYCIPKARYGLRMFDAKIVDLMVHDGLWDVYNDFHMGNTGEIVAERNNITREQCDEFAAHSHQKAEKATENGWFKDEIIPIEIPQKKKDPMIFDKDEGIRYGTTTESMASLKPFFKKDGVVTAGNASQITDGASATVVMSKEKAKEMGIKPMVTIKGYNFSGVKPELVMEAPLPGVADLLKKMKLTIKDIDLVEHNEAFSSASLAVMNHFKIPKERFNVHGGAVALGHPIGSSGSRILITLMHAMNKLDRKRGLATICLGGGNAVSMVVER
ncbi:MAG: acetyl-CoA C-acetyltransferase [Candidatus Thermoplasmatota archaeon]|nr:acetyl-CoA C-acetyltransferase [Candidatus Thermoplasmatota archaeon]